MNKELEELKEYLIKKQELCNYNCNYNSGNVFAYGILNSIIEKIKEIETNTAVNSLKENGY